MKLQISWEIVQFWLSQFFRTCRYSWKFGLLLPSATLTLVIVSLSWELCIPYLSEFLKKNFQWLRSISFVPCCSIVCSSCPFLCGISIDGDNTSGLSEIGKETDINDHDELLVFLWMIWYAPNKSIPSKVKGGPGVSLSCGRTNIFRTLNGPRNFLHMTYFRMIADTNL